MMSPLKLLKNGMVIENPTFVLVLGLCPTLAVTTNAINGFGMGLAATAVLMGSNVMISMIRKFIPDEIRIPAFIVVIAGFVTIAQLLISGYAPALDKSLGIFIPLIVVNCIILARAEAFAFKNGVIDSLFDGMGM
ncbi:MAG: electron transport complex subunit RsxE, partial [Synergistaceae bacterium]|nr:electron transport complex subunit RsxE [Synergistaceae bacterium]